MSDPSTVPASEISAREIARRLAAGAVAILPTETVYGLAIQPGSPSRLERVYALKGRPREMSLPVIVGSTDQLAGLGVDLDEAARRLTGKYWPGPLTIVFGFAAGGERPPWLAGREEVAVRLPGHDLLRQIALAAGPLLVTSANGHGAGAKTVAAEAAASLHGEVDLVVDGGELSPLPSTIVNTRVSPPRIEREGALPAAEILDLLGVTRTGEAARKEETT